MTEGKTYREFKESDGDGGFNCHWIEVDAFHDAQAKIAELIDLNNQKASMLIDRDCMITSLTSKLVIAVVALNRVRPYVESVTLENNLKLTTPEEIIDEALAKIKDGK